MNIDRSSQIGLMRTGLFGRIQYLEQHCTSGGVRQLKCNGIFLTDMYSVPRYTDGPVPVSRAPFQASEVQLWNWRICTARLKG